MKGYDQVIDNLVYYGIKALQTNENWEKLEDVVRVCADTYGKTESQVILDYSHKLRKQLLSLIYN
jgi:hypothetical protein